MTANMSWLWPYSKKQIILILLTSLSHFQPMLDKAKNKQEETKSEEETDYDVADIVDNAYAAAFGSCRE